MIPRIPFLFSTGNKLDPFKLMSNFERMYKDLKDSRDRNISKSCFIVDFQAVTAAMSPEQRKYYFQPPSDAIITKMEVEVFSSGSASSVTVTATGLNTLTASVTSSSGNRGYDAKAQNLLVSTSGVAITVESSANVASVKVTFSIQSQRIAKRSFSSMLPRISAGTTLDSLVAVLNAAFLAYEVEVDANTNASNMPRFEVITIRNDAAANLIKEVTYLSAKARYIKDVKIVGCYPVTDTLDFTVSDEGGNIIGTSAITGLGATIKQSGTVSVESTQVEANCLDFNNDWTLVVTRNAGTANIAWLTMTITYL